jgi:hypothetical protein
MILLMSPLNSKRGVAVSNGGCLQTLKAFTWGYYGWGSASKDFVRAVDAHEAARGFLPPLFIDIRFHRSVKAANFQDRTFERIVGSERYLWEKRLGNKQIREKTGPRLQIADPHAAADTLDRIVELGARRQRVLMFCSCIQALDGGEVSCHRTVVADLLLKAAKKRRVRLEVAEWPGDDPVSAVINADVDQERALSKGLRYVPIGPANGPLPPLATLGWGSQVHFKSDSTSSRVVTGPAYIKKGKWHLEILTENTDITKAEATSLSKDFCRESGYGAHGIRQSR